MEESEHDGDAARMALATPWPGRTSTPGTGSLTRVRTKLLRIIGRKAVAEIGTMNAGQENLVAFDDEGVPSVEPMQRRASRITDPARLCVLLLLRRALRALPPEQRCPREALM